MLFEVYLLQVQAEFCKPLFSPGQFIMVCRRALLCMRLGAGVGRELGRGEPLPLCAHLPFPGEGSSSLHLPRWSPGPDMQQHHLGPCQKCTSAVPTPDPPTYQKLWGWSPVICVLANFLEDSDAPQEFETQPVAEMGLENLTSDNFPVMLVWGPHLENHWLSDEQEVGRKLLLPST